MVKKGGSKPFLLVDYADLWYCRPRTPVVEVDDTYIVVGLHSTGRSGRPLLLISAVNKCSSSADSAKGKTPHSSSWFRHHHDIVFASEVVVVLIVFFGLYYGDWSYWEFPDSVVGVVVLVVLVAILFVLAATVVVLRMAEMFGSPLL